MSEQVHDTNPSAPHSDLRVILVAPNVSEQMGGEAIKALQIYLELERQGVQVQQVTHERVRSELERNFPKMRVKYATDGWIQQQINRTPARPVNNILFQLKARPIIEQMLQEWPDAVVHYTAPVSPVLPYFPTRKAPVLIGPINGNINYPPPFYHRETFPYWIRRLLQPILQKFSRFVFSGKRNADALLVAGGQRTIDTLLMGGCKPEQIVRVIDSGVMDRLMETPRVEHRGQNLRFVHNGRLVKHKGADLVIRALAQTQLPVRLDIIGRGPELPDLRSLATKLNLNDRVTFIEWFQDHSQLAKALREYRAFVFPSLCEANGIVVQEAMVMGLPVICADWGGPALLVKPDNGFLVKPLDEAYMIRELARCMDTLADDGELAERLSVAGRQRAIDDRYIWSAVIAEWTGIYQRVRAQHALTHANSLAPHSAAH